MQVKPIRNEEGLVTDFEIEGDFPKYGNNDSRVDEIAVDLVERFMTKLRSHKTYRNSEHTMSVLTITSNVVYGKKTGTHQMDVKLANHLHLAQTQCMVVTKRCIIFTKFSS